MGASNAKPLQKRQARVVMMGLDLAGKSTILYKLKQNHIMQTSPTVGFNVETLHAERNMSVTVWDIGGQDRLRPSWEHYLEDTDAVVFVVDSTDEVRLADAKDELKRILYHAHLMQTPFLVLANKQDAPNALSIKEIVNGLNLEGYENRVWEIRGCSAYTGEGLPEALNTLAGLLKHPRRSF